MRENIGAKIVQNIFLEEREIKIEECDHFKDKYIEIGENLCYF
jgi:hypothetical protein